MKVNMLAFLLPVIHTIIMLIFIEITSSIGMMLDYGLDTEKTFLRMDSYFC